MKEVKIKVPALWSHSKPKWMSTMNYDPLQQLQKFLSIYFRLHNIITSISNIFSPQTSTGSRWFLEGGIRRVLLLASISVDSVLEVASACTGTKSKWPPPLPLPLCPLTGHKTLVWFKLSRLDDLGEILFPFLFLDCSGVRAFISFSSSCPIDSSIAFRIRGESFDRNISLSTALNLGSLCR